MFGNVHGFSDVLSVDAVDQQLLAPLGQDLISAAFATGASVAAPMPMVLARSRRDSCKAAAVDRQRATSRVCDCMFLRAEASLLRNLIALATRVVAGVAKAHCQQAVSRASLAHVHSNCTKRAV